MTAVSPSSLHGQRAAVLLVDDRRENLLALQAILEPLGLITASVTSGTDALKELLLGDFACILLDVQMPGIDGFELAELIKQRERSAHIPILFLTALSQEERHVFRGYSAGAVDYMFKPVDPDVLRSKVSVFVELWEKNRQLTEQAAELHRRELDELEQASEQRYRQLADAMPQIVWTSGTDGSTNYFNRRWFEYTGMAPEEAGPNAWLSVVHPDDLPGIVSRREQTLATGDVFEAEYRFRAHDGTYRWHLGRAAPIRSRDGAIEFWVGTATDIHDRKLIEEQRGLIMDVGDALSRTLDYRESLKRVAELVAERVADWCSVYIVETDGTITEIALAHRDPSQITFARELQERYPADADSTTGAAAVIRHGEPELVPEIPADMLRELAVDDLHYDLISQLGLESYMCVPIAGRSDVLGAITFVSSSPGRRFDANDLQAAEELARRAAMAIENARLYRETEERAEAARVLASIGDGVVLVDRSGRVRLWNAAAERITELAAAEVLGRRLTETLSGWPSDPQGGTVLLDAAGRELWLSISAVAIDDGIVYAFRDLTHERALESMRQDLVATVSHELRTPLAAIYGAALTLRREDVELEAELQSKLLEVIAEESGRLSEIVNDLLLASQLDTGKLQPNVEPCDPVEIVELELAAAQTHLPENVELRLDVPPAGLPPVVADAGQLRQVLSNLIDNAVKYSPQGGAVDVVLEQRDRYVRFSIRDTGLGIPREQQSRIFEKFYRLDPDMKQGIGGTGLGLYICRELVRRVDGRIWVESNEGSGSTFVVEIPCDRRPRATARREAAAASRA